MIYEPTLIDTKQWWAICGDTLSHPKSLGALLWCCGRISQEAELNKDLHMQMGIDRREMGFGGVENGYYLQRYEEHSKEVSNKVLILQCLCVYAFFFLLLAVRVYRNLQMLPSPMMPIIHQSGLFQLYV